MFCRSPLVYMVAPTEFLTCPPNRPRGNEQRLTRTAPAACGCAVGSIIVRAHLRHHRSICCSVPPKQSSWYSSIVAKGFHPRLLPLLEASLLWKVHHCFPVQKTSARTDDVILLRRQTGGAHQIGSFTCIVIGEIYPWKPTWKPKPGPPDPPPCQALG
ncbi:uncharacterized protein [Dermacentor albipictus]|uniref:uncharacterized protein isoform X9 n=1 Tax=Dermacentor albipictus TaxID=60249 RepID=UPI0031FD56B5